MSHIVSIMFILQNDFSLLPDSMLKKEENSAFNNLVKYPCNSFGKPSTEVKINRKTAFGTTTLVLTDFSNKCSPLERRKCQHQVLDGEFRNSAPTNVCFGGTLPPSEERAHNPARRPNAGIAPSTVCSGSQLSSPACKKLRTTHRSSPSLKSHSPRLSTRYDACHLGL